jgi:hypothetical protein
MQRSCAAIARSAWLKYLVFALAIGFPVRALAIEGESIVRVEEDWELLVTTPDTISNSPQVTCAMSPVGDSESAYMSFELNHQSQPEYAVGGLHLHAWNGEFLAVSLHAQARIPFETSNETITWTQSMTVSDGTLTYEVSNGSSTTWGTFGNGELRLTVATQLTNLHGYRIHDSLAASGVGFGANRVQSLVLKKVRFVTSGGQVYELTIEHNVLDASEAE